MAALVAAARTLAKRARPAAWQHSCLLHSSSSSGRAGAGAGDVGPRLRYWTELWAQQQDVFTLPDANPNLVEFLHELLPGLPPPEELQAARKKKDGLAAALFGARAMAGADDPPPGDGPRMVFVPLCGRSSDMAFLAGLGGEHVHVVGLDAVSEPLRLFATEHGNGLVPVAELESVATPSAAGKGLLSGPTVASYRTERYPNLTLVHGDVFAVDAGMLGTAFHAVWDRGGLTSIEPGAPRAAYAARLASLMAPRGRLLLEFLSCNLPLEGAASVGEVGRLLAAAGLRDVRVLRSEDVRGAYPGFAPPGLAALDEVVLVATKGAASQGGGGGGG